MSDAIRASIVVPVLNGMPTVTDMLRAVASQAAVGFAFETILVDGGSRDGTVEAARAAGVTVLEEPRRGPGIARDVGLRAARGEIICHIDADTVPTRRWLAELVAAFDDPSVVLAGGKTLSFPPTTPAQRYMAASGRIDSDEYVTRPIFPFVPSRNMAVRREAALAIDGWAEECITGEDVDFCHRLLAAYPSTIAYRERAIVFHYNRETDDQLTRQAWAYGEGAAHLYLRYPDEVSWGARDALHVGRTLATNAMKASVLSLGERLGRVPAERAELARYDHLWWWSFWRGFYSFRRTREYR
jgi:glycosyltransferase involved in cell wall biosynthesis